MAYSDEVLALNPDHLWSMDNVTTDTGVSLDNRPITTGSNTTSFVNTPIVRDSSYHLRMDNTSSRRGCTDVNDMNAGSNSVRSIGGWLEFPDTGSGFSFPYCVYKEGGNTNNICIFLLEDNQLYAQATVDGSFTLTYVTESLTPNRPYHILFNWYGLNEGREVALFVDGKRLGNRVGFVTDDTVFPAHSADIYFGDSFDTTLLFGASQTATNALPNAKYAYWTSFTSPLTDTEIRVELFEKGALPLYTVTNQAELDALSGTTITDVPLGILVDVQGNITLDASSITFSGNSIDVQYIGTGTLTWVNSNSDAQEFSTPYNGSVVIETPASLTIDNIVVGSRYYVVDSATGLVEYANTLATSTTEVVSISLQESSLNLDIKVRKSTDPIKYKPFNTQATLVAEGASVFIAQVEDTIAL